MAKRYVKLRWTVLGAVILVLIIAPFVLFGEKIDTWTQEFLVTAHEHRGAAALVLGGLLASDILLPVPSSIVSTACGLFLGTALGTLTSLVGMSISCILGYCLARWCGRPITRRFLGDDEVARLDRMEQRFGDWVIVITRPVPVLAEAAVLVAGLGSMRPARFIVLTTLSNAGISLVYAVIGDYSGSFLLAFCGAILMPMIVMAVERMLRK